MDWTCAAESSATAGGGLEEFELDEELVPAQETRPAAEERAARANRKIAGRAAREFFGQAVVCIARRSAHLRAK